MRSRVRLCFTFEGAQFHRCTKRSIGGKFIRLCGGVFFADDGNLRSMVKAGIVIIIFLFFSLGQTVFGL